MKQMLSIFFILLTSTALCRAAETKCDVIVYVADEDLKGLNVRDQPSTSGSIIGVLPVQTPATNVTLIADANNSWVKIAKKYYTEEERSLKNDGFVFAGKLGISTTGYGAGKVSLRAQPSDSARIRTTVPADSFLPIQGCSGKWLKVKTDKDVVGWLAPIDQCASDVTTCG